MDKPERTEVVVTDIRMKFGSMVIFLVKLTIASIPALVILYFLLFLAIAPFAILFGLTESQ